MQFTLAMMLFRIFLLVRLVRWLLCAWLKDDCIALHRRTEERRTEEYRTCHQQVYFVCTGKEAVMAK